MATLRRGAARTGGAFASQNAGLPLVVVPVNVADGQGRRPVINREVVPTPMGPLSGSAG